MYKTGRSDTIAKTAGYWFYPIQDCEALDLMVFQMSPMAYVLTIATVRQPNFTAQQYLRFWCESICTVVFCTSLEKMPQYESKFVNTQYLACPVLHAYSSLYIITPSSHSILRLIMRRSVTNKSNSLQTSGMMKLYYCIRSVAPAGQWIRWLRGCDTNGH
jgi:hypothetical protein